MIALFLIALLVANSTAAQLNNISQILLTSQHLVQDNMQVLAQKFDKLSAQIQQAFQPPPLPQGPLIGHQGFPPVGLPHIDTGLLSKCHEINNNQTTTTINNFSQIQIPSNQATTNSTLNVGKSYNCNVFMTQRLGPNTVQVP